PTPRERLQDAEDVRGAAPYVLVVLPSFFPGTHRQARPGCVVENHRPLVEDDNRLSRSKRACIQSEHVFHPTDELIVDPRHAPHFFSATASTRGSSRPSAPSRARHDPLSFDEPPPRLSARSSNDFGPSVPVRRPTRHPHPP